MKKLDPIFASIITLVLGFTLGFLIKSTPPGVEMESAMHRSSSALENLTEAEFEKRFLDEMIAHHEGAVGMAKLIEARSGRQELHEFGNAIITAQSQEIEQMKRWKEAWFGTAKQ